MKGRVIQIVALFRENERKSFVLQDLFFDKTTKRMLAHYKGSKANALFQLIVFNIPLDVRNEEEKNHDDWTKDLLFLLADAMELDANLVDAYYPLTVSDNSTPSRKVEELTSLTKPYIDALQLSYADRLNLISIVMLFFVINRKYDGKGRTFMKQLVFTLGLARDDYFFIENRLGKYLHENAAKIDSLVKVGKKKDTTKKMIRYAKIGTVALGAGAVLAVTGGLAAPAIAGALLIMGSSSAAALVSMGAMAGIFGSAGAGLAGYKMMKRTKTLTDFEFESHGEQGHLAIMVMISGWMKKENDYQRAFGVVPDTLPLHERLGRYYYLHCPHRLPKVTMEAAMFEKDPDSLFDQLTDLYGFDPRDIKSLLPPERKALNSSPEIEECFQKVIEFIDQLTTKHSFFSGFKGNNNNKDKEENDKDNANDNDKVSMPFEISQSATSAVSQSSANAMMTEEENNAKDEEDVLSSSSVPASLYTSLSQLSINGKKGSTEDAASDDDHDSASEQLESNQKEIEDDDDEVTIADPTHSNTIITVNNGNNTTNEKEEVVSYDYW